MRRTRDVAFFECPICGKKPHVQTYDITIAWAFCKGYGFHRHKKVEVIVPYEQPSILLKRLSQEWNQLLYTEARLLYHTNGHLFNEVAKDMDVPTKDGGATDGV